MRFNSSGMGGKVRRATARFAVIAGLAAGLASVLSPQAMACSILPPQPPPALLPVIGETEEQFRARQTLHFDGFNALQRQRAQDAERDRQISFWTQAQKAAVVEIVRLETGLEIPNQMMGRGSRATVRPVGWIKGRESMRGRAGRAAFALAHTSFTSCGPSPNWSVFKGQPGDRFVVFFSAGAPGQETTLGVLRPSEIVAGDVTAAMAAQVR